MPRRKARASGPPSERRGKKKPRAPRARLSLALKLTALFLVLAASAFGIGMGVVYPARPGPGVGREVELVVPGDESPGALGARLAAAGLVQSPRLFAAYWKLRGASAAGGVHLLTDDLAPRELAHRLERRGRGARVRVTLPEGWTRFDIARRLHAAHVCTQRAFLQVTQDRALLDALHISGDSAEGFLFPATYDLAADSDAAEVVRRLKAEFDRRWAVLEERHASGFLDLARSFGWGAREVVILASLIEKEAAVDEERPLVASVFLNRLRDPSFRRKVLQSDPTAGYGCLVRPELPACAHYAGRITHEMNADPDNPYSTYTHERLPPGPIANPGARSIEAVLAPASTRFLYFVARGGNRHTFSETYDAHSAAVRHQPNP